jgi:hypothetical protein
MTLSFHSKNVDIGVVVSQIVMKKKWLTYIPQMNNVSIRQSCEDIKCLQRSESHGTIASASVKLLYDFQFVFK